MISTVMTAIHSRWIRITASMKQLLGKHVSKLVALLGALSVLALALSGSAAVEARSSEESAGRDRRSDIGLTFRVMSDKATYTGSEPVLVDFAITNTGKRPVWVNKRFYLSSATVPADDREVFLTVTSPSGKELPCIFSYPTGFPKSDYFQLLAPGQEATSENKRDLRAFFELKEPGTYRVVGTYQNVFGEELGLDTFKDPLRSASVTFTITQ